MQVYWEGAEPSECSFAEGQSLAEGWNPTLSWICSPAPCCSAGWRLICHPPPASLGATCAAALDRDLGSDLGGALPPHGPR